MGWDQAIGVLREKLPKFNKYLLYDYRKEQVNRCIEFMDVVYREAILLFEGKLLYHGYRILSPERRISYNVENMLIKGRVNIQQSELQLVEYMFEFENEFFPVYIYLPYLHNDAIVINDTKYYIQLAIIERMIYRVTDGVIIKVMRSPLQFWRTEKFSYTSTEGKAYFDTVITVKAHYRRERSSSRPVKTPLILYLLAVYDFDHLITQVLGLPLGSVSFTSEAIKDDPHFSYFKCKEGIYLKVDNETVLDDVSFRRFVASLLYILSFSKRYTISDVYERTFYKMLLGKNLYGPSTKEGLAAGHAESHLDSLKSYLDQYTKKELELLHIYCNDVFDLFTVVFFNIDTWLISYSPNDLFEKRIGGIDIMLMDLVKATFTRFYETLKKNKVISSKNIKTMLRMDPMKIGGMYQVPSLQPNSSLYNDNTLFSILIKKIRQSSSRENASKKSTNLISAKEHQFHPSFLAVESALSISSSSPGISGDINPFVQIDKMGYFLPSKMPWYSEITDLSKYLVKM